MDSCLGVNIKTPLCKSVAINFIVKKNNICKCKFNHALRLNSRAVIKITSVSRYLMDRNFLFEKNIGLTLAIKDIGSIFVRYCKARKGSNKIYLYPCFLLFII